MSSALDIRNLGLRLGGQAILRDISLSVGEGQRWSIVGPNGAGKSSLLRCLMRIHGHWEGQVSMFGQDLSGLTQRRLARHLAYVAQPGGEGPPAFTVTQFVAMGRFPYAGPFGAAHPDDEAAVDQALQRTGLLPMRDRALDTLSGGEAQKVYLAAALAQQSRILLLDEPTAFLDYRHQAEVAAILRDINRNCGTTVLSVTHDVNTALAAGGMVLALAAGQVAWTGPAAQLADERLLSRIFGAPFRLLDDPLTGRCLVVPGQDGQEPA